MSNDVANTLGLAPLRFRIRIRHYRKPLNSNRPICTSSLRCIFSFSRTLKPKPTKSCAIQINIIIQLETRSSYYNPSARETIHSYAGINNNNQCSMTLGRRNEREMKMEFTGSRAELVLKYESWKVLREIRR